MDDGRRRVDRCCMRSSTLLLPSSACSARRPASITMKILSPIALLLSAPLWSGTAAVEAFSPATPLTSSRRRAPRRSGKVAPAMGLEVKIRMVGKKNPEKWIESAYSMYETRLKPTNLRVSTQYHKSDDELVKNTEGDESKSHRVVLLDPLGKMCTSEDFSEKMYGWLEEGGSRLTFVIGGAEGLPEELRGGSDGSGRKRTKLSLGMMTFTHQFARILLLEQIYRASEIRKGTCYHK